MKVNSLKVPVLSQAISYKFLQSTIYVFFLIYNLQFNSATKELNGLIRDIKSSKFKTNEDASYLKSLNYHFN